MNISFQTITNRRLDAAYTGGRRGTFLGISFAALPLLLLAGCMILGPAKESNVAAIRSGDSFGECLGYCISETDINEDVTGYEVRGWQIGGPIDTLADSVATEPARWGYLASLARAIRFETLDEVYGCPDCADGGAEWIEVVYADRDTHRVTFEFGNAPTPIRALADTMRTIRRDYREVLVE